MLDNNYRTKSQTGDLTSGDRGNLNPGRVVDVILNSEHKYYDQYGGPDSIGVVLYIDLADGVDTSDTGDTVYSGIAYPLNKDINTLPVKNEIILIQTGPGTNLGQASSYSRKYYQTAYNLWNHPHHSAFPTDIYQEGVNIGEAFDINDKLAPLQPFPGDTIISGRLGQTIRMSGTEIEENKLTDDSNKDKPFIVISNGQKETQNGFSHIVEDINEDPSSIYFTSDHSVPLFLANNKRSSYDKSPDTPSKFQGSQLLLNSDRLVLNARSNEVLISGQESIGINSKTINIDGEDYMCIDADKIYIGSRARTADGNAKQPVMLGHQVETYLQDVIDVLEGMAKAMMKAKTVKGDAIPQINMKGASSLGAFQSLKNRINPKGKSLLKSTKTFVE